VTDAHDEPMTQRQISIDNHAVTVIEEGEGPPQLVLHDELGDAQSRPWHTELARDRRIVMPQLPGFGSSPQVEWISSVRDLAGFTARMLRAIKLDRLDVIGISFGGWLAAEMAVNRPETFARLVLVASFGIKPRDGEIRDLFLMSTPEYLRASVRRAESADELARSRAPEAIEEARAEVARIAWSPYMHNPSLSHLLRGVTSPTMVVWGENDAIIPSGTALQYREAMPDATVATIADCGHHPEVEATAQFVALARKFLSTDR
jgi:pimeloyl-ACP methyl ester carboxylesterase